MTRRMHGFSIVELLVVVSILVLLIALLLPALGRSRESSREMYCLNNLKHIMAATQNYAGDNDEYMPFPNWGGHGVDVGGWQYGGWLYKNLDGALSADEWVPELAKTAVIYPYLDSIKVYRCPNDPPPHLPMAGQLSSYTMNGSACGFGSINGEVRTFRISNFSGDDIMFWEVDSTGATGWWWDGGNFPHEGLSQIRHREGGTLASIDGRVEFMQQVDYLDLLGQGPGRLWNAPDSHNGH